MLYLSFKWVDEDSQILLDPANANINQIFAFIEDAVEKIESVLVVSSKGQSRCSTVAAAYFMKKYRWTLLKSLEYLNSRRPELEIRTSFIQQLSQYETSLNSAGEGCKTSKWNELYDKTNNYENEEMLLRNTFINSQMGPAAEYDNKVIKYSKPIVGFVHENVLATEIPDDITSQNSMAVIVKDTSTLHLKPIIKLTVKKISRNSKIENERSYKKKKETVPKYIVTKGTVKQIKLVPSEKQSQLSERKDMDAFISPTMNPEDFEPKAHDPYKRTISINSHKAKLEQPKTNNFVEKVEKEIKPTACNQFTFKIGASRKETNTSPPSNITNILQNPSINNIIILNQPNIHVLNQNMPPSKKYNETENKRPSSCKPKQPANVNKEPDKTPFTIKSKGSQSESININTIAMRASVESSKAQLNNYKSGPVKPTVTKSSERPASVPGK